MAATYILAHRSAVVPTGHDLLMGQAIGTMDAQGVRAAVAWAEAEGWQPGIGDDSAFFAADPQGFLRAVEGGRTIATISVVRGSPEVAFVGFYIVDPEFRGRGIGKALWDEALSRFAGFTFGLDAVPEQVDTYAREGFVATHGNTRYSTEAGSLPKPAASSRAQSVSSVPFESLVAFDAGHFFGPRPEFLRHWTEGEGRDAAVTTEDGEVTGFGAVRRTTYGHRIGPLFAGDAGLARSLILTLADGLAGPVAVDAPRPNRAAIDLFEGLGMEPGFKSTRMYRGPAPQLPLDRIFGTTSLELG